MDCWPTLCVQRKPEAYCSQKSPPMSFRGRLVPEESAFPWGDLKSRFLSLLGITLNRVFSQSLHPARVPSGTGFSGTARTGVTPSA